MGEAQKVSAQTRAVLKSTGKAAKVSAKQVDQLAEALMTKSGVDDEVIKSGENMLLTFTNIRNEVGKGNKIFTQATKGHSTWRWPPPEMKSSEIRSARR